MIIAHPPCTYFAKAQIFRLWSERGRKEKMSQSLDMFLAIASAPCPRIAIENPIGVLSTIYKKPSQIIYPWMFGDPHSKDICLWLKGLPPLISTCYHFKRQPVKNHVNGRMSQALKSKIKSRFFPPVAEAMATQWG
jgi:hypothetical protein